MLTTATSTCTPGVPSRRTMPSTSRTHSGRSGPSEAAVWGVPAGRGVWLMLKKRVYPIEVLTPKQGRGLTRAREAAAAT